jgi:flavorubredoxin
MSAEFLKDNIFSVGVKDPGLRVFDIIMETKRGTTYNSFVINDEKVALVDICKNGFYDEFKENLKEVIGDKKVDYVIVQHTELDHSGTIKMLLKDYPEAIVIGTRSALTFLKNIINESFNSIEAKEELKLGRTTLQFIPAPNLHWPDTMFTYVKEENVLFTCDFTGCHFCPEQSIEEVLEEEYFAEMKYYFECIMGPFKSFAQKGLEKIKDLDIDIMAPSHGPIHKGENVKHVLGLYKEWSIIEPINPKRVELFYISAYGNTANMANYLKTKLEEAGFEAGVHEINARPIAESIALIEKAKGFMVGSPTITSDAVKPAWDLLSLVNPVINRGKAAMAFGSFGWSGEGVPMLTDRLKSLKLKVVEGGLKFNFVPSEEDYKKADEMVEEFIKLM